MDADEHRFSAPNLPAAPRELSPLLWNSQLELQNDGQRLRFICVHLRLTEQSRL